MKYNKLSAVVPAYNEDKTVAGVVEKILKLVEIDELVLVDDGSTDNTEKKIRKFMDDPRFVYTKHSKNRGKGGAIRTGVKMAKNEVILILDADLKNITHGKIRKIFMPVLRGEVDVSRATFSRSRGRVTEYAVKPMMKILFPDIYFEQPISGQICAKKSFLGEIKFKEKYGVDIGILFDAIESGQKIVEVDIGRIDHKANEEKVIQEMSQQVLEAMIQKAGLIGHKYKMVIFTLDNTLLKKGTLDKFFARLGIENERKKLIRELNANKITFKEYLTNFARLLKGLKVSEFDDACLDIKLADYAVEVVSALTKRRYKVAIISPNFCPLVNFVSDKLGIDQLECVDAEKEKGVFTGAIKQSSFKKWMEINIEDALSGAFSRIVKRNKIIFLETILVVNSAGFIPILPKSGLSIASRPMDAKLKGAADKTINTLPEILALIE